MKHFVEFKMEDGGAIIIEVDEPETGEPPARPVVLGKSLRKPRRPLSRLSARSGQQPRR